MTISIGSAAKSDVTIRSALRPGAMEPISRSRPKCWAVLSVAIWMAVIGFKHGAHALPNARDRVFRPSPLVIVGGTSRHVGVKWAAEVAGRIVSAHGFAR